MTIIMKYKDNLTWYFASIYFRTNKKFVLSPKVLIIRKMKIKYNCTNKRIHTLAFNMTHFI